MNFTGWVRWTTPGLTSDWTAVCSCSHEWMAWVAVGAIFRCFPDAANLETVVLPEGRHPEELEVA